MRELEALGATETIFDPDAGAKANKGRGIRNAIVLGWDPAVLAGPSDKSVPKTPVPGP